MVNIIKDKDLIIDIDKYDIILVGANIYCNLSNGFARDVALNYPFVRTMNLGTIYGDIKKLGNILQCEDEECHTKFCLLYICKGFPPRLKKGVLIDYLSYESLESCLKKINILYKGLKVACPYLGCSRFDGNGEKERVMKIIESSVTNFDLTIYDFFQKSRDEKLKEIRLNELSVKEKDYNAYYEMVKKRKAEAEERFKKNGFARY